MKTYLGKLNRHHAKSIQGLRDLLREAAFNANSSCYPFNVKLTSDEEVFSAEIICIDIDESDVTIVYQNDCGEQYDDSIELFSYDEIYGILCELCKRL